MFTPKRMLRRASQGADPLPQLPELRDLNCKDFRPRRGQLMMLAGQPGTGKSGFALWYTAKMNLPTLYFSADMNRHEVMTRLVAIQTGCTTDEAAQGMEEETVADDVFDGCQMEFNFDPGITWEAIQEQVDAWVIVYDEYPAVIVVDNLLNIMGADDYQGQSALMAELHGLARTTGALVFVLHHTSEASGRPVDKPPARKDILNKVSHFPELILTGALNGNEYIVAIVKNRTGRDDKTGDSGVPLTSDMSRCSFSAVDRFAGWTPSNGVGGWDG